MHYFGHELAWHAPPQVRLTPSPHVAPREAALVIFPGRCSGVRVVSTGLRQGHWPTGTSGVRAAVARPSGVMWTARGWRPGALSLLPAVRRQARPGSAAEPEAAAQAGLRNTGRHRPAHGPQTATSRDLKQSHFHKATGQSQPEPGPEWQPGAWQQREGTPFSQSRRVSHVG